MNIQVSIHSAKHATNLVEQIRRISNSYDGIILMAPTLESEDYEKISKTLKKGSTIALRIIRDKNGSFLTLKIPK